MTKIPLTGDPERASEQLSKWMHAEIERRTKESMIGLLEFIAVECSYDVRTAIEYVHRHVQTDPNFLGQLETLGRLFADKDRSKAFEEGEWQEWDSEKGEWKKLGEK
jgi:hypothetical protein